MGCHFPPPGDLPDPVIEPSSSTSPALQVDYLLAEPLGDARVIAWKRIIRALITKTVLSLWKFEEFRGYLLGTGNGNPLQYSCLENPMDGGAWWATVHGSQRVGHDWATSLSLLGTGDKGQSNSLLYNRATPKHSNGEKKKNQKVRASRGRNWSHTKVCISYDINILNSHNCC